jgi:anti-sigma regulatory factor (Ser/Thr protein kinase)
MESQGVERWFEPELSSAAAVRAFVRDKVAGLVDDEIVALMASELAINAVTHAGTPFLVRVIPAPSAVRVEVVDGSPDPPLLRPPDMTSPTGRGLHIVRALATAWGVQPVESGKRVWFEYGEPSS